MLASYSCSSYFLYSLTINYSCVFLAQFTHIPGQQLSRTGDMHYDNVQSPEDCAKYCVTNYDFTCNSFDFCATGTNNCRLNKRHIGDGATLSMSTCDHFSSKVSIFLHLNFYQYLIR